VSIDYDAAGDQLKLERLDPERGEAFPEFAGRLRPAIRAIWKRLQPARAGRPVPASTPLTAEHVREFSLPRESTPSKGYERFLSRNEWRRSPGSLEKFFHGRRGGILPRPSGGWRKKLPNDSELDTWIRKLFGQYDGQAYGELAGNLGGQRASRRKILALLMVGHRWRLTPEAAYHKVWAARATLREMGLLEKSRGGRPRAFRRPPAIPPTEYVSLAVKKLGLVKADAVGAASTSPSSAPMR